MGCMTMKGKGDLCSQREVFENVAPVWTQLNFPQDNQSSDYYRAPLLV